MRCQVVKAPRAEQATCCSAQPATTKDSCESTTCHAHLPNHTTTTNNVQTLNSLTGISTTFGFQYLKTLTGKSYLYMCVSCVYMYIASFFRYYFVVTPTCTCTCTLTVSVRLVYFLLKRSYLCNTVMHSFKSSWYFSHIPPTHVYGCLLFSYNCDFCNVLFFLKLRSISLWIPS